MMRYVFEVELQINKLRFGEANVSMIFIMFSHH
jgi:hypothetical protein